MSDKTGRLPIPDELEVTRLVAILRHVPPDALVGLADALHAGGIRAVEVTMNSRDAAGGLKRLASTFRGRLVVGAGTVLDVETAETAIACGATFLVSPHVDPNLIAASTRMGVPFVAGAMTPTEVLAAWHAGAALVKLFPAGILGARYVAEVRGPFGDIPLLTTGGVNLENATSFIAAGAWGLGVGGALTGGSGEPMDRDSISRLAAELSTAALSARSAGR